jgi:hypothetical protein
MSDNLMGKGSRTRNYDEELKQEQLTKARTQIGTQVFQNPDLARLVMAWPSLSDERKKIISSLLNSP